MHLPFDSDLARLIYCGGYELVERHFVNAFLRPGDIFIDAGANIGLFTIIAAATVGPTGAVHAFEPCTAAFERLRGNVCLNGFDSSVSCHRVALSSSEGMLTMAVAADGHDAWNSPGEPTVTGDFITTDVVASTLDSFASRSLRHRTASLMKIDVEGWETHLLAGGRDFFRPDNAPVLLVEFNSKAAQGAGSSTRQLYGALSDFGYELFTYDPETRSLAAHPYRPFNASCNLIAAKRSTIRTRLAESIVPMWMY
jgi:FkbM family methyltransferase